MKIIAMLAVLLAAAAGVARAEDAKPVAGSRFASGLRQWFLHVKEGLAESSVSSQRQKSRITAVAAVRGAEQGELDPEKPVWKSAGAAKKSRALKAQRQELAQAVDTALAGDWDAASKKLDAFEAAHPESPLLADAHEIRGKLTEARAAAAAEAAPETEEMAKAKLQKK